MEVKDLKSSTSTQVWDERLYPRPDGGTWLQRCRLGLDKIIGSSDFSHLLIIAIQYWDDPPENMADGLAEAERAVISALTSENLCLHVISSLGDDEWDLAFYTGSSDRAMEIADEVQQTLPEIELIPEISLDRKWNYYLDCLKKKVNY